MAFNVTFTNETNTFYDLFSGINAATNNFIVYFLLYTLFLVIFIVYSKTTQDYLQALAVSGFMLSMISIMFVFVGLLPQAHLFIPIAATLLFILLVTIKKKS